MNIIMSIRKQYWDMIKAGKKDWEYRKRAPRKMFYKIFFYDTSIHKIAGEFITDLTIFGSPAGVWKLIQNERSNTGLTEQEYFNYFKMSKTAYAIHIDNLKVYDIPIDLKEYHIAVPQSFNYTELDFTGD